MSASPSSRLILVPPPLIYALAFLAGLAADRAHSWRPAWMQAHGWIGWLLIAAGIIFGPLSAAIFLVRRTTLIPASRPNRLITSGVFRISRNPMYLGLTAIYAGLAIVLGYAWPFAFLPIPVVMIATIFIPTEEAQLRDVFGEDFATYCNKVRRWL